MCPSDSRQVSASRTTRRLPSTACSMLSVSWSKVCLNQAACCWGMVIGLLLGGCGGCGLPDELGVGLLPCAVHAVDGDDLARSPEVVGSVGAGVGVVGAAALSVDRAVHSLARDALRPVGEDDVDERTRRVGALLTSQ